MRGLCEQCREARAEVCGLERMDGGWAGRFCQACAERLGVQVVDQLTYAMLLRVERRKALERTRWARRLIGSDPGR